MLIKHTDNQSGDQILAMWMLQQTRCNNKQDVKTIKLKQKLNNF